MRINPLFLCLLFLGFSIGVGKELCLVFLIALLHECGHLLMSKVFGVKVLCFKIQPWGVCMETEAFHSCKKECLTAIAGPLVNVILLSVQFVWKNELFMVTNLFMLLINLLPVLPLDGGRIVRAILEEEFGEEKAESILFAGAGILSLFLFITGIFLFYKTGINFSVIMIAIFIACSSKLPVKVVRTDIQRIQQAKHYMVPAKENVAVFLKTSIRKDCAVLDLVNEKGEYLGSLTGFELMEEIAKNGYEINFAEILQKQLQNRQICSTIDTV